MIISSFDVDAARCKGDCRLLGTATSGVSRRETNASRRLQRHLSGAGVPSLDSTPFSLIIGYQRSYGCADRARGRKQSALSAGRRLPELLSIYPCLRPAALMTGSHLASSVSTCFFSASGVDP